MQSKVSLIRALGAEFLNRKFVGSMIVFAVVAIVATALLVWLVSMSAWWLLLAVPLVGLVLFGTVSLLAVKFILGIIKPRLNSEQKTAIKSFVDKLERVAEQVQMPPFMIFFNVARDVIKPRKKTFIASVVEDSTTLKPDFQALQKLF